MNRDGLLKLDKEEIISILLATLSVVEEQASIIEQQSKKIKELTEKIAELEARLKQNSKNSSMPPSSDVFVKPSPVRKASGKKAGGQVGHKGTGPKLMHPPDVIIEHNPVQCTGCVHETVCTSPRMVSNRRYEVDIEIKTIVTEHHTIRVQCHQTNEVITGGFPVGDR
jgi:transposase